MELVLVLMALIAVLVQVMRRLLAGMDLRVEPSGPVGDGGGAPPTVWVHEDRGS